MDSLVTAKRAQSVFEAAVLDAPLIPISNPESHFGQLDAVGPPEESKLPSALNTRCAWWPFPGLFRVPVLGAESKLPDDVLCLNIIFAARAPPGTELLVLDVLSLLVAAWVWAPDVVAAAEEGFVVSAPAAGVLESVLVLEKHPARLMLTIKAPGTCRVLKSCF